MGFPAIFGAISSIKGQKQGDQDAAQLRENRLSPDAQAGLAAMQRRQESSADVGGQLAAAQAATGAIEDQQEREQAQAQLREAQAAEQARMRQEEEQRQAQGGAGLGVKAV
jgi:hypothetical protein